VRGMRRKLCIPLAVKLGPFFSAPLHLARRLEAAGANGLVLFNRFYQPDFDLDKMQVVPSLRLSAPDELLLRLHWTAMMYGQVNVDLAITGGVHTAKEVLKAMMAGARVAMMTSALLRHGIDHLRGVLDDLFIWMREHEYATIREMQGSMSLRTVSNATAFQ